MGAVKVFPSQVEEVVAGEQGLTPHYEIVVDREDGVDTLEVRVEISESMPELDEMKSLEQVKARVARRLDTVLGVKARVTLVEPRSIARPGDSKARRVVDRRRI
jgi:phenylacetate-CoA ligase